MTRAKYSNRCLPERNGRPPTEAELAAGFDANGNLRELQVGQKLEWDLRNQLTVVRPVVREEAEDDYERYIYDGGGQRVRKLRASQTHARTLISEVRYLSGVEIRSHGGTGEVLHVISANAGSNSVQVLHWVAGQPEDIANNQVRYSLNDHLQSSALELDQNADLISQEWYYPFGGTACFAARSAAEAKYKTVRYSGKERDATGLYYYGFRYYAPWLQRWINPDPAGYVDGPNLYRFVGSDPVNNTDTKGLEKKRWQKLIYKHLLTSHGHVLKGHHINYIAEQIVDKDRRVKNKAAFRGVLYFNQQQRAENLMTLKIKDGIAFNNEGQRQDYNDSTTTSSSSWFQSNGYLGYALGFNEQNQPELALFEHKDYVRFHSSLFSGRPVLDAGMMIITNGNIAFIENKSGHYRPRMEQKLHTLNYLKKGGMDLRDIFVSELIPRAYIIEPAIHYQEIEDFFERHLYNAADLYNWHMDTGRRPKTLPEGADPKTTTLEEPAPHVYLPRKGKEGLTRLETLTYRNWEQRDDKGRPGKLLKNSHLSYN
ncbi:UNVERIFIED_ORG: RHS repeat-associated protein [Pseudomonas reinekei]|nr:RHS repeat-associated protein [Pseudomonas reinekei]